MFLLGLAVPVIAPPPLSPLLPVSTATIQARGRVPVPGLATGDAAPRVSPSRQSANPSLGEIGGLGHGGLPALTKSFRLSAQQSFALGMIETGNRDEKIGRAGEVSRYQIMPSVWKHYSGSDRYLDPGVSLEVACQHWAALRAFFQKQARREPTDFDLYVLWNTRLSYYGGKGFDPKRLSPGIRDRARRFVNLVEDRASGPDRLPSRRRL